MAPTDNEAVVTGQVQEAAQLPGRTGGIMFIRERVQKAARPLTGRCLAAVSKAAVMKQPRGVSIMFCNITSKWSME